MNIFKLSEKPKNLISIRRGDGEKGFTFVEVMIAMTILVSVMIGIAMSLNTAMAQLKELRVKRTANDCGRAIMEYLSTLPPDVVYAASPGTPIVGDFSTGGILQLKQFVYGSELDNIPTACMEMSNPASVVGKRVNMKYSICPGCNAYTEEDTTGGANDYHTCKYTIKVRIEYNGLHLARSVDKPHKIDFMKQLYEGKAYPCVDTAGIGVSVCGIGSDNPDTPKMCYF